MGIKVDRRRLVLATLVAIALTAPGRAGAAPAWLPVQPLPPHGLHAFQQPRVKFDAAGDAFVVFTGEKLNPDCVCYDRGIVQVTMRPVGGSWTTPLTISADATGISFANPKLAVDPAGDVVVAYQQNGSGDPQAFAVTRPAGGVWSQPVKLSPNGEAGIGVDVAMDATGHALAAWSNSTSAAAIETREWTPQSGWSPVSAPLTSTLETAYYPRVALDARGDAVAAWWRNVAGDGLRVEARSRPAGGAWGDRKLLSEISSGGQITDDLFLAIAADGSATALWSRCDQAACTRRSVEAADRPSNSEIWSSAVDVDQGTATTGATRLAVAPGGTAYAIWIEAGALRGSIRPPAGTWSMPGTLAAAGAGVPDVTVDAAGDGIAAWAVFDFSTSPTSAAVWASIAPLGGTWAAPTQIAGSVKKQVPNLQVGADSAGNALAVWARWDTTLSDNNYTLEAAPYDGAGPIVRSVTAPTAGGAGQSLQFAVDAFDAWSPLGGPATWSFGDGTTASGDSVVHVFGGGGTFDVSVTKTDALGNASSATRQVTIAPPPPPPPPPPVKVRCVVPKVKGKTLAAAKKAIKARHCSIGKVKRAHSKVKKGRVIGQSPSAGRTLAAGAKVNLVVSLGRRQVAG